MALDGSSIPSLIALGLSERETGRLQPVGGIVGGTGPRDAISPCIFWDSLLIITLPETNSSHLKLDPWKRRFLLETIILVLGSVYVLLVIIKHQALPEAFSQAILKNQFLGLR